MSKNVRVRFAPSPTGPLHIGGVRTALFNYLFAKKHQGTFVLRIEDTDQNRFVPGAEKYIKNALNWCQIPFDEGPGKEGNFGPYKQSERKELYRDYAEQLIASGNAYYAFDTEDTLAQHRKDHENQGKTFIYNWHNREKLTNSLSLPKEEVEQRIGSNEDYVIRFKAPKDQQLNFDDLIRGKISVNTEVLDDKVLFKSDGMPTYHLANIVDDHLMEISHVIRGEEWLPSLPLHILMYNAFEWEQPQFAHLPLILKPVGQGKLSKRDGDKLGFPVFPLEWKDPKTNDVSKGYREEGYLPEAVVNMLAFLGWNPGTEQELFDLNDLVTSFDFEHVNASGAKFDPDKALWFQQQYMHKQPVDKVTNEFEQLLREKDIETDLNIRQIVASVKERAIFVSDIWTESQFFFEPPAQYDEKSLKKVWKAETATYMNEVLQELKNITPFEASTLSEKLKLWIKEKEIGFGKIMMPLRVALVGSLEGPDIFESMEILGEEEVSDRIKRFIATAS